MDWGLFCPGLFINQHGNLVAWVGQGDGLRLVAAAHGQVASCKPNLVILDIHIWVSAWILLVISCKSNLVILDIHIWISVWIIFHDPSYREI